MKNFKTYDKASKPLTLKYASIKYKDVNAHVLRNHYPKGMASLENALKEAQNDNQGT